MNIQNKLNCIHCNSNNLKIVKEHNVMSPINQDDILEETIINYCQLSCNHCYKETNILILNNEVISKSELPEMPLQSYTINFYIEKSALYFKFSLKENNLIKSKIFKIQEYLEYYNICIDFISDNTYKLYFNKEVHRFLSKDSILKYINKIFSQAGCNLLFEEYNNLLFDIYVDEEDFIKYIRKYKESDKLSIKSENKKNVLNKKNNILDILNSTENFVIFDASGKGHSLNSIRESENCVYCKSTNINCTNQNNYKNTIDENGKVFAGNLLWKEIKCQDCKKISNIIIKNNEIIKFKSKNNILIPMSALSYKIDVDDSLEFAFINFSFNQINSKNYSQLELTNILGIEQYFKNINIEIKQNKNNIFSLFIKHLNFKNKYEVIKFINDTINL